MLIMPSFTKSLIVEQFQGNYLKSTSHDYPTNSNRKVIKILQRLHRCHHLFIYLQEQTRQHAVTIVAMEERLLRLTRQNRQLEQEAMHAKQTTGQ